MDFRGIPVRTIGAGSQPAEQDGRTLSYIDMPKEMSMYRGPGALELPESGGAADLDGARQTMRWLQAALAAYRPGQQPQLANLTALDADNREVVNQVLGEGEVSITCGGPLRARTQESVLAGVWRTLYLDQQDRVTADLLEVADIPHYVRVHGSGPRDIDLLQSDIPADVSNALPILVELDGYRREHRAGQPPRIINLSLLPVSESDLSFLDEQLGHGPVEILSRSYGKCQISSTAVPGVWWVRYYNSMSTLILNTLEVAEVPLVACAAPEDLRDSAARLDEILAMYREVVA